MSIKEIIIIIIIIIIVFVVNYSLVDFFSGKWSCIVVPHPTTVKSELPTLPVPHTDHITQTLCSAPRIQSLSCCKFKFSVSNFATCTVFCRALVKY